MQNALRRFLSAVWLSLAVLGSAETARAQTAVTITTQPGAKTANVGTAVTFSVVAAGTTPTYQWLFNGNALSGATSASYTIPAVTANSAGGYSVVVSNSVTSPGITSTTVNLLVYVPDVIRTAAGQIGVAGSANGSGTGATFFSPQGLVCDSTGNLYIADSANNVIRRMTPAGVVTTVAGQAGSIGSSADGRGTAAQFNNPTGLAIDGAGNLYVADTFNSTIRKILPDGTVSTLAGLAPTTSNPSNTGSTNATGTAARFNYPRGVAVDGAGNVYVADTVNDLIRKVTPAGVVTTVAGGTTSSAYLDGTGTAARFSYPYGIASDANGNLRVADTSNQVIRAITSAGVVTTLAGLSGNAGSSGGTGNVARFSQPTGVALDNQGNLFVADYANHTIREIYPSGAVVTVAGLAGNLGSLDGSGTSARLYNPLAVTLDSTGNLYIADTENDLIRVGSAQPASDVSPTISTQPISQTATSGATVTLSVTASGTPTPTYQWQKNAGNISGATNSTLILPAITAADAASYDVIVTNRDAILTSSTVTLTVLTAPTVPPGNQSQSLNAGSSVTLSANATGGSLSYQWMLNGTAITGATGATYTINPVGTYAAGTYTVKATNALGTTTGTIGTLTVAASARLLNLSAQGPASSLTNVLSAGFFITGGNKAILVRGIGPALAVFSVASPLATPQLSLTTAAGASVAVSNSGWSANASTAATLAQVFSQVFAFPLTSGSQDQAIYESVLAGASGVSTGYTAIVSGAGGSSGQAMVEIYDADSGTPAPRLINLSARANVGSGTSILTGGFVISGTTSESVLLRGIGPTLASFGITGFLAKPVLTLYNAADTVLATNSAWGGSAAFSAVFTAVSAFPLPAASSDDAIITTLAPGTYTVQVKGANSTTGVALVEIYEIPVAP